MHGSRALLAGTALLVALGSGLSAVPAWADPVAPDTPAGSEMASPASSGSAEDPPPKSRHSPRAKRMRRLFMRGAVAALFLVVAGAAAGGAIGKKRETERR